MEHIALVGRCATVALVVWLAFGSDARAELTESAGSDYAALCEKRGVPSPPVFGGAPDPRCAGAGCVTGQWHRSGQLSQADGNASRVPDGEAQSFNSPDLSEIFYYVSTAEHAPGLCVANARRKNGATDFFGVICQGTNGKVCFWDQGDSCKGPPGCFPFTDHLVLPLRGGAVTIASTQPGRAQTSGPRWVGGAGLRNGVSGSNNEGVCSDCHAGENAFVNHPGTATDILGASTNRWGGATHLPSRQYWFPVQWPDPIVPAFDSELRRAWPENPGPGPSSHADSVCFSCHRKGGAGGRFPGLSRALPGYCNRVLGTATNRAKPVPACARGDLSCPSGAMPPTGPAPSPSYPSDSFARYARDVACARSQGAGLDGRSSDAERSRR
ncbi:MAG TPA: hypothetical protein VH560_09730 [Polyangia bacterium]|nr:hypothetical protein [Polyangia bacterium]